MKTLAIIVLTLAAAYAALCGILSATWRSK